ncbi:MAG: S1C family serine protease [Patescibacteria group bacterium]
MFKKIKDSFLLVISLTTLCGLVAGFCGALLTRVYILEDVSSPYTSQELNLTDLNNNNRSNLIIRDPKKVVVNQDVKVEETINSLTPSLVSVFKEIAPKRSSDLSKSDYYSLDKPLFQGLIITSDGWVMSSLPAEFKDSFSVKGYVAIASDRKIYIIDKVNVIKNSPGEVIFFHLSQASNLPVRKIVPRSELSLGQSLIVVDNYNNVWPSNLSSFKKTPDILNSDSVNARLALANNSDSIQKNSFIFNLSGDLVAVVGSNKDIIPAFSYTSYWQGFGQKEIAKLPFLGINYLDLSLVKVDGISLSKGALIYPDLDKISLLKNSPASISGLAAGDIITWIDNQELSRANDLADLVAGYKPGDKITLTYIRAGQEKQVDIKLGELK